MSIKNMKQYRINTKDKMMFRAAADGTPNTVSGHAAVFNTLSPPLWELGGACEVILPGAFTRAIAENDDVRALVNHDANLILARSTSGTLKLSEDNIGLAFEFSLPNTSYANDLAESMKRGDISQCSFGFIIDDSDMTVQDGQPVQQVKSVQLLDVSVVVYPAYPQTDASLRSHYQDLIASITKQNDVINTQARQEAMDSVELRKRQIQILELL